MTKTNVTPQDAPTLASDAELAAHAADTTAIHGIADTAALSTTSHDHDADYEATGAVATHAGLADPHTGYRLESADHSHASAGLQGGTVAHTALTAVGIDDHHAQVHATAHESGGGDAMAVDAVAATGSLRTLGTGATQAAVGTHTHAAGGLTLTPLVQDLGAGRTSGTFDISGLSGLTADDPVLVVQTAAPIASKGDARDEMEFDAIQASGYVVDATTIRVYWNASGVVVGDYAFGYTVSG